MHNDWENAQIDEMAAEDYWPADDWEFALMAAQTGDLECPTCGYPVDVLDTAIVCPVCDVFWKSADEMKATAEALASEGWAR